MRRRSRPRAIEMFLTYAITVLLVLAAPLNRVGASINHSITLAPGKNAITEIPVTVNNALPFQAAITLSRDGSDNTFARRRVRMELDNPSGTAVDYIETEIGHDSNQASRSTNGTASNPFRLSAPATPGSTSCSGWKVRLKDIDSATGANDPSSQPVKGKVEFLVSGLASATIPAPPKFGIEQSDTEERNINVPYTGNVTIQANWDTDELTLDNYPLTFRLINTNGTVVASNSGYSRDSLIVGITPGQRMKISYTAKCEDFGGAQHWKIRVSGSSKGKVKNVDLKASIVGDLF